MAKKRDDEEKPVVQEEAQPQEDKQSKSDDIPTTSDPKSGDEQPKLGNDAADEKAEVENREINKPDATTNEPNKPNGEDEPAYDPQMRPKTGKTTNIVEDVYTGTAERTFTESSFHPDSMRRPYNPDPLVQRDWTYRIYEEMLEDDQVSVALQIKKDLVAGSGFYFETEDEGQEDIKKHLEISLLEKADRPFTDILEDMMQCFEFGFSVAEKIFKLDASGMLCLRDIKPRHPSTWLLHTDKHGNMQRYEQRGQSETIDADPNSLIHYTNNSRFQNPYGRSDLYPAFQAYMTKRHITRFYAIFLEKAASPTPVAKYDRRADPQAVTDIFNAIKKFQTKTALTIPKDFEIEFLEAKSTGEAYIKGINLFNMFIGRALFIPDLVGFQGSETGGGSYSLGKDQIGLFFRHIYKRRAVLERLIDLHIVRPICTYNYGMTEGFPKFKFNALSEEDGRASAELWIKAVQGKMWKPTLEEVNHFRSLCKFPQSDIVELYGEQMIDPLTGQPVQPGGQVDEEGNPIATGQEPGGAAGEGGSLPPGKGADAAKGQEHEKGKEGAPKGQVAPIKQTTTEVVTSERAQPGTDGGEAAPEEKKEGEEKPAAGQVDEKEEVKKKFSSDYDLSSLKGDYHKKCNFQVIDRRMSNTVDDIMEEAENVADDIFEALYDQIQKKKILEKRSLDLTEKIDLPYLKKLQLVFKKYLRRLYMDSKALAAKELGAVEFAKEPKPLPDDEFLKFLDQETFKYVGDWEYNISRRVKDELVRAIKDGKPLSSVIGVMDDEGKKLSKTSLERFARTKTTEVFNKGRKAYFDSRPEVEAYQYSAILDDRTTDTCGELHGLTFLKADAPVPPLHFNCRSTLIPITKYEDWSVDGVTNSGRDVEEHIEEALDSSKFPRN